jgi:hypothetical protein
MVLLAAGCAAAPGAGTTVGTLSSISTRLCFAGPNAVGDCFSWASTQPVLGRARLGDCVVVSTRQRPGAQLATNIDSVDPRDWPQACPLPLTPERSAEPSSCGWLYEAGIESPDGKSLLRLTAGACAGHRDPHPSLPVWVHPGDRIVVRLAGGQSFTDDLPRPHSGDAGVLRPTSSPSRQAAWAVSRPGRAQLVAATPFCGSFAGSEPPEPEQWQTCPVISVLVKNRA